jgi:outer membrane protein TolC
MIPWPGKLDRQASAAVQAAEAERLRFEAERLALSARVRNAWYEYAWWAHAVAIARENRDLLRYFEEVARARYTTAAAGQPAVLRAQVELGRLDDRVRSLEELESVLAAQLNAALGRPAEAPVPAPAPEALAPAHLAVDDPSVLAWLRTQSPALLALDREAAREQEAVELARQQYFPDVTRGASVIDTDEALMPGTRDSGKDPVMAMVSVNVPIWFDRLASGVREARARHWAALARRAEQANQLEARSKMLLYQLRDAERKADLYANALVPRAEQSVQTSEQAFRTGGGSFLDLLDAERALLEFQLAHARALADHAQRLAELEALVGRPLPTVRVTAPPPDDMEKPADDKNEQ